jgi:hypothetical protein
MSAESQICGTRRDGRARERPCKLHVTAIYHDNEADTTIEELLLTVFSVRSVPRLYYE